MKNGAYFWEKACHLQSMPMGKTERKLQAAAYPVAITYSSFNLDVLHCSLWWFMRLVCFLSDSLHNRILKPGSCVPNPFDPLKTGIKLFCITPLSSSHFVFLDLSFYHLLLFMCMLWPKETVSLQHWKHLCTY